MYKQFQLHFSTHCLMEIYVLIILINGLVLSEDAMADMCGRCLNNSTCRIITNLQSNSSTIHCACVQGWLGDRCQVRVRLLLVSVTMTTATLQWETQSTDSRSTYLDSTYVSKLEIVPNFTNGQSGVDEGRTQNNVNSRLSERNGAYSFLSQVEFNVNYWSKRQRSECNIVPNLTRTVFTISGLDRETEYTFCAKTDHSYTCDFDLVSHLDDLVSTCVSVTTKADDNAVPIVFVIVSSCIAFIGLIVLVVVVIISKRNNYFSFLVCVKQNKSHRQNGNAMKNSSRTTALAEESRQDIYLLKSPKINQTISISAPNCPGKPIYKIKKRLRGYAAFSAQNEQTIPLSTVLEYTECDLDEVDDSDTDSDVAVETETDIVGDDHQITDHV